MLFGKRERAIRRILIVEDEPLVAFDNEHLLRECGYEVVATVDTLADAVRVLGEEQVDLVLSDIQLNGDGNGLDVARAAGARQVPVLFVTAHCPIERDDQLIHKILSQPRILGGDQPDAAGKLQRATFAQFTLVDRDIDVGVINVPECHHE